MALAPDCNVKCRSDGPLLTAPPPCTQPITLTLDIQSLYPPSLLAGTPFPAFMKWYINFSRDPILLGAMSSNPAWDWLKCFLKMEAFVQLPSFFIGAYGLYKSEQRAISARLETPSFGLS
jgi:hypothetical protein